MRFQHGDKIRYSRWYDGGEGKGVFDRYNRYDDTIVYVIPDTSLSEVTCWTKDIELLYVVGKQLTFNFTGVL